MVAAGDAGKRAAFEPGEARVRDDQPADRVAGAIAVPLVVAHGGLDEAAERQLAGIASGRLAGPAGELDAVTQALRIGADREAHAVGPAGGDVDHPRSRRGNVNRRGRKVKAGIDGIQARHRRDGAVDLDLLAP